MRRFGERARSLEQDGRHDVATFEIDGAASSWPSTAARMFKFTEAISFVRQMRARRQEIDHYGRS